MQQQKSPARGRSSTLVLRRRDQATVAVGLALLLAILMARQWRESPSVAVDAIPSLEATFQVDVNRASAAELAQLPGIGETLAQRIIEYREQHGPLLRHDDLIRVKGIGPRTMERLRPHLAPIADDGEGAAASAYRPR